MSRFIAGCVVSQEISLIASLAAIDHNAILATRIKESGIEYNRVADQLSEFGSVQIVNEVGQETASTIPWARFFAMFSVVKCMPLCSQPF